MEEADLGESLYESLRLYALCTQFNVLPISGGVYDQDPRLLIEWGIISEEVAKVKVAESNRTNSQAGMPNTPPKKSRSYATNKAGGHNFRRVPPVPSPFRRYHKQK